MRMMVGRNSGLSMLTDDTRDRVFKTEDAYLTVSGPLLSGELSAYLYPFKRRLMIRLA